MDMACEFYRLCYRPFCGSIYKNLILLYVICPISLKEDTPSVRVSVRLSPTRVINIHPSKHTSRRRLTVPHLRLHSRLEGCRLIQCFFLYQSGNRRKITWDQEVVRPMSRHRTYSWRAGVTFKIQASLWNGAGMHQDLECSRNVVWKNQLVVRIS